MMAYWWVNHKQTYSQETQGGYIWSPKARSDGVRNHFYDNMTKVQPGDVVFSYANAQISNVGIAQTSAVTGGKPGEFGRSGDAWSTDGWKVAVHFYKARHPVRPANHMDEIGPLLPEKYSPIKRSGGGNQGAYLASVSERLAQVLFTLLDDAQLFERLRIATAEIQGLFTEDILERSVWEREDIPQTEKEQLVLSRRGQGRFRNALERVEPCCRITKLSELQHLRASHIKPWKDSTDKERLDGNNGLLLAPHIDHMFDRGYLTFEDDGQVSLSSHLSEAAAKALSVGTIQNVGTFLPGQRIYLAYHRERVFLR